FFGCPSLLGLTLPRQELQTVSNHVERTQYTTALWASPTIYECRQFGAFQEAIEFFLVAHPSDQFLGRRFQREQVCKDLSRTFDEECVLVRLVREQRCCEGQRFRLMHHFVGRRPIRTTHVQGIQDKITAGRIEKLRRVFERRIIHNGRLAPLGDLHQHPPLQNAFSGARVPHHHHVAAL